MGATAVMYDDTTSALTLRERLQGYISASGKNITQVAAEVGIGRPTLSQYLNDKYASNSANIEGKVRRYLEANSPADPTAQVTMFPNNTKEIARRTGFFASTDFRNVLAVLGGCQKKAAFGLITGGSGLGKSFAIEHYAKKERVACVRGSEIMRVQDVLREVGAALGLGKLRGTPYQQQQQIAAFCNTNPGYLIIVDEADKLLSRHSQKKIEIFRDIYDTSSVGVVLCGEPKLQALLEAYLERSEKRVGLVAELHGLSVQELDDYLRGYDVTPEALVELRRRGCTGRKSCFRLLDITLDRVFDLLKETGGSTITLQVIEQACDMMAV